MIIGLGFQAYAGKDTVADQLVTSYGFRKVAFATAIKKSAEVIFGLTKDQLYGDKKDVVDDFWDDTPRNILQYMGTECMRHGYRDDVWIKALFRYIDDEEKLSNGILHNWVISDVRFPDEADAIKEHGGILIRVDRPESSRRQIATKNHASETSLTNYNRWNHVLVNDGSISDLMTKVHDLMESLR